MAGADSAWAGALVAPEKERESKPRKTGITMVIDKGLGLAATRDLMEAAAPYIDFHKLGFGTSLLYGGALLKEKIRLIRSFGVEVYPGGTLLELAGAAGRVEAFLERARELGFTAVEVSEGTLDVSPAERARRIRLAKEAGFAVVTEVGKKARGLRLDPAAVAAAVEADLALGAQYVIVEGRDSGSGVGVYDDRGDPIPALVEEILAQVSQRERLIWEAPLDRQQKFWLKRLGCNASLGNVQPPDVLALEAMRQGLRGDTLKEALERAGPLFGAGVEDRAGFCRKP